MPSCKEQYRLDPELAKSLRVPVRQDLTPEEKRDIEQLSALLKKLEKAMRPSR